MRLENRRGDDTWSVLNLSRKNKNGGISPNSLESLQHDEVTPPHYPYPPTYPQGNNNKIKE